MVCNGTTNRPSEKGLFTVVKVHSSNVSYMYTLQDRDFPLFLHYEKQEGRESKSVGNLCLVVVAVVVVVIISQGTCTPVCIKLHLITILLL